MPPERGFGQLWQVPTFLLGVLCLCLVAANSRLRHDPAAGQFQAELAQFRQALDDKSGKIQPWLEKSGACLAQADRFPAQSGEAYFLVGSLYWRASEDAPAGQELGHRSKAEEYLEKALASKSVSDKDVPNLKYRLGSVLYRQGQEFARAVELMKDGLNRGADGGGRGYDMLLQAILKHNNPNLQEAIAIAKRWLERCGDNAETQHRARIALAELLIRVDNRNDAIRYLEPVARSPLKELRFKSQRLLASCLEAGKQWRQARLHWEQLLKEPESGGKGQVLYCLGVCSFNEDDNQAALNYWHQVLPLGGEEGQAAALRVGETQMAGATDAALKSWSEALAEVRRPADYHNAYISLDQVREMIESAESILMDKRNFEAARKLADLYERVAKAGKAELQRARAYQALASTSAAADAAALFDKAGLAYEQAAMSGAGEERTDYFRRAAECYRQANKYAQSVHVLEQLVKLEKSPLRLAENWLDLAEAHAALKQTDRARQAFRSCIGIPNTPSADRARFRLAVEEMNVNNLEAAIEYLKQIPVHSLNRAAFEEAQFLHGSLLMQMKKYDEAEIRLEAAIKEAPSHASAYRARAELADCYRKQAEKLEPLWNEPTSSDSKVTYKRQWQARLGLARDAYQSLADDLALKSRLMEPLSDEHLNLLRLASFTAADILVDLGEVDEAIRRYQYLQQVRYQRDVEGLIACDRIWRCLPLARAPQEAQKMQQTVLASLKLAEDDLGKLADDNLGFKPPARSRQEWQNWISKTKEELSRPQGGVPIQR